MSKQCWLKLIQLVPLMLVAAALPSTSQGPQPTSIGPAMADFGAGGHAGTKMIFPTTVASIHSGNYLMALRIADICARVVCVSVFADMTTMDTTDSDARDCLDADDDDDYVIIKIMYMHLEAEEVFGGNAQGSAHSCTVIQQLCTCPGCILNTSSC